MGDTFKKTVYKIVGSLVNVYGLCLKVIDNTSVGCYCFLSLGEYYDTLNVMHVSEIYLYKTVVILNRLCFPALTAKHVALFCEIYNVIVIS